MRKNKINIEWTRINTNKTFVFFVSFVVYFLFFFLSCSFDYGELEPTVDNSIPDLVMENVDYVRVRSAQPQARFQAERAERYEELNVMKLEKISFEQFGDNMEEINALGTAGSATVEIDSGNIIMKENVKIEVESEDITIETDMLEWLDEPRTLSSGENEEVTISMSNGGSFIGIGLFADALNHTWQFQGSVMGDYIFEDDEIEETEGTEEPRLPDGINIDYFLNEDETYETDKKEEADEDGYISLIKEKIEIFIMDKKNEEWVTGIENNL